MEMWTRPVRIGGGRAQLDMHVVFQAQPSAPRAVVLRMRSVSSEIEKALMGPECGACTRSWANRLCTLCVCAVMMSVMMVCCGRVKIPVYNLTWFHSVVFKNVVSGLPSLDEETPCTSRRGRNSALGTFVFRILAWMPAWTSRRTCARLERPKRAPQTCPTSPYQICGPRLYGE